MAEPKTKPNAASVDAFLEAIPDDQVRKDCAVLVDIMQKAAKAPPKMWGAGIVGFGTYRHQYAGGREADNMLIAFAPRKANITLYINAGFEEYDELMSRFGKHGGSSKSCVHIKRLADVHLPTLRKVLALSVKQTRKTAP